MSAVETITLASAGGIFLVLAGYPLFLWLMQPWAKHEQRAPDNPGVVHCATLIVVVRNGESLIDAKIDNFLALDYPPDRLQLLICSDGSTDRTAERVKARRNPRIRLLESPRHRGKNQTLNAGVATCDSDVLVFSDADARLHPLALQRLLAPMADPRVGGVCGQRVIGGDRIVMSEPQQDYIRFDSSIKGLECRLGSITSNDGKLYAMRRALYRGVAKAVTDDLYNCLLVVDQGYRFVFAPGALAFIRTPSRNPLHELARRRRIIARSLNGINRMRGLLNPLRNPQFATGLLINKILRRLLPLFQAGLLLGSILLASAEHWAQLLLAVQCAFYALALMHPWLAPASRLGRLAGRVLYFNIGSLGTLLGLFDFIRGRRPDTWEPLKSG